jgi:hypothetical protein
MALGRLAALSGAAVRLGNDLQEASLATPLAARMVAVVFWALAAALVLAIPALRKRKVSSPARLALAALFAALAAGEALGFWSSAGILSGWLLFQGI